MIQEILLNVLIFCGIVLLVALSIGVIQLVIMIFEVRRTTKKITKQVEVVTSIFDIGSLLLGGMEGAKNRANIPGLVAGIKKGLQVLFNKEGKDNG